METLIAAGVITIWLLIFVPMAVALFLVNRRTSDGTINEMRLEANLTISQHDVLTDTPLMVAEGAAPPRSEPAMEAGPVATPAGEGDWGRVASREAGGAAADNDGHDAALLRIPITHDR